LKGGKRSFHHWKERMTISLISKIGGGGYHDKGNALGGRKSSSLEERAKRGAKEVPIRCRGVQKGEEVLESSKKKGEGGFRTSERRDDRITKDPYMPACENTRES